MKVLGNSFKLLDQKSLTLFEKEGEKSDRVDYSYKTRFTVGPVPMSVTVGARGEAGVKYYVQLQPGAANALITPFVDTEAYVDVAGVDIEVASAGAGAAITLVEDELFLKGHASLQVDSKGPYIWQDYSAQNVMETLNGRLYLFVKVYVCEWDDLSSSCGEKRFEKELADWDGFLANDYLFKKTASTYLQ